MSVQQRESRFDQRDDVVVMKFGGTSVEDKAAIQRLIGIVQSRLGAHPVVVVSALAKVTDQLLEAGRAAAKGHLGAALAAARRIYVRHEELAESLVDGAAYSALDQKLRGEFRSLEALLLELERSRVLNLKTQDQLLGFGESFSSHLVQETLCQAGIDAQHVDARACIITDDRHGQAAPLWDVTNQRIQDAVTPMLESNQVPVFGGFIASTLDGAPTTLGRGGSDFTAAILGAALCAARIEIWTDVDGIMTTDPKLCSEAQVIRKMSFDEAAELANSGAKVLHPATLAPARRENIPVYVLNSRRPEGEGTEIAARPRSNHAVNAIAVKRNIAIVEIEALHADDTDLLRSVYAVLDRYSCQFEVRTASHGYISLLVDSAESLPAIAADLNAAANVRWQTHKALLCLVGENIRRQPDLASRVFAELSEMKVFVSCQSASHRAISFAVDESKVEESVQRLHALLFAKAAVSPDWGLVSVAYCQAGLGQA